MAPPIRKGVPALPLLHFLGDGSGYSLRFLKKRKQLRTGTTGDNGIMRFWNKRGKAKTRERSVRGQKVKQREYVSLARRNLEAWRTG